MMKRNHTSLCASAAIAAALALGSTPLFAQAIDAPIAAVPDPVPAMTTSAPVPTSDLPPAQPEIVVPTIEPAAPPPAVAREPARPAATASRTAAPAPAARRPVTTTTTTAPAPPPVISTAEPIAAPAPVAPIAEPAAAADVPADIAPADTSSDNSMLYALAAVFGVLAVFALALWGFFAIGRRRTPAERVAEPVVERPIVAEPVPMVAEPTPMAAAPRTWANPRPAAAPVAAAGLSHSGAAVSLPRKVPDTFEERDALLKRMIAAKPDRANPFVGYKARLRRARLILQSLGQDFSDREPWIDLSQYSANWPELARSHHAAA
jgi:hypothetical protein